MSEVKNDNFNGMRCVSCNQRYIQGIVTHADDCEFKPEVVEPTPSQPLTTAQEVSLIEREQKLANDDACNEMGV